MLPLCNNLTHLLIQLLRTLIMESHIEKTTEGSTAFLSRKTTSELSAPSRKHENTQSTLPGFLKLSTEFRQKIILETVSDKEILTGIDLRARPAKHNHEGFRWVVDWHIDRWRDGIFRTQEWRNVLCWAGHPQYLEDAMVWWTKQLKLVLPTLAVEMEWVQMCWRTKIKELGRLKIKTWESIFGEQ